TRRPGTFTLFPYTTLFRSTKVSFANEIGNIAKASGVDGREVMDVVCRDHKLNLSRYYLSPGFAFGGSCLPKDVRALTYKANQLRSEEHTSELQSRENLVCR